MDWMAAAFNETADVPSMNLSSRGDEIPNFDNFLGTPQMRQQQQQQPRSSRPQDHPHATNKAHFDEGSAANPTRTAPFGNVRIHHTEMQRYLQGLMQSSQQYSPDGAVANKKHSHKMVDQTTMKSLDDNMVAKPSLKKENGGCGSGSLQQMALFDLMGSGGGGASGTSSPGNSNAQGDKCQAHGQGAGGGGTRGLANSPSNPTPNPRQKNDKAVEVHLDRRVIARFRTQTECARYLRATPEAVSYHCSKGGGVCNGLLIRPLGELRDEVASDDSRFGLFEGAVEHRPKERPQLKPETVAILKEWLLSPDHMDNPYPNQREAELLMSKTGLDKTQLKHWFNNARKRILKPLLKNGGKAGLAAQHEQVRQEAAKAVSSGTGKRRGASPVDSSLTKGGPTKRKRRSDSRGGQSPSASAAANPPSLLPNASLSGTISSGGSSSATQRMSANLSSPHDGGQGQMQQQLQMQMQRMRQRQQQQHFGDTFQDFRGGNSSNTCHKNNSNNNNSMPNQLERLMGYGGTNDCGMSGGQGGNIMSTGNGILGGSSKNNQGMDFNSNYNGGGLLSMGGALQGRGSSGMGGFQSCIEVGNDSSTNDMFDNRFNDYTQSRVNSSGSSQNQSRGQGEYHQDNSSFQEGRHSFQESRNSFQGRRQNFYDGFDDGNYCQPQHGQGGHGQANQDSPDEAARSNAVFKQQVATMAMNEASAAFKDMEDAFSRAREVASRSRVSHPDNDPAVFEANAQAKKLQSVAMFKLKVSQRASEEAANAYDCYQRMVDCCLGGDGGGGNGSTNRLGNGSGGYQC